jgi:hypothetical protein
VSGRSIYVLQASAAPVCWFANLVGRAVGAGSTGGATSRNAQSLDEVCVCVVGCGRRGVRRGSGLARGGGRSPTLCICAGGAPERAAAVRRPWRAGARKKKLPESSPHEIYMEMIENIGCVAAMQGSSVPE